MKCFINIYVFRTMPILCQTLWIFKEEILSQRAGISL